MGQAQDGDIDLWDIARLSLLRKQRQPYGPHLTGRSAASTQNRRSVQRRQIDPARITASGDARFACAAVNSGGE